MPLIILFLKPARRPVNPHLSKLQPYPFEKLRQLFAGASQCWVPLVHNPHVGFGGVVMERLCTAFGARGGMTLRLRELFDDARQYEKRRAEFEQNRMRRVAASRLDLEALLPALQPGGALPFVVEVHRASDILAVLRFAKEQGVRVILSGCEEGWQVAREIAAAKVPVIVSALDNLPEDFDGVGARLDNAALLVAAGVSVAISTRLVEPHNARTLRFEVGNAVAHGLPWESGIAAVTKIPATIFGLNDRGTLEPGKAANVVVWTGDPFETSTRVRALIVRGKEIPLVSRQTLLRERYRDVSGMRPRL